MILDLHYIIVVMKKGGETHSNIVILKKSIEFYKNADAWRSPESVTPEISHVQSAQCFSTVQVLIG